MKNLAFLACFLFISIIEIHAQYRPDLAISKIPLELLKEANAVVRHESGRFEVESIKTAKETRRMTVTRFNKEAGFKNLYISYDMNSKVGKVKIELYDAFGNQIRKVKKDEIKDYASFDGVSLYSDNRYKKVDLTHGNYPYTIVYEYEIQHKGLLHYPREAIQSAYKTSIENWDFTIKTPENMAFQYRVFNLDIQPKETVVAGFKTLVFAVKNEQPFKREPLTPTETSIEPIILFIPEKFGTDQYIGDMSSWDKYGKFMYELNSKHNNLSTEMIAKVKEMTAAATTDVEKIDILYKYVQENMRYVSVQLGIGGWKSYDAAYVEKNKYGDCKALTWFTKSMLESIGIASYPALVLAGREHTTMSHPEDFSYPRFNHVILTIPSEETWLECTSNDAPTNYLGSFTDNRSVLLITEEGGKLSRTPTTPIEKNARTTKTAVKLSENGAANIVSSSLMTGPSQERLRSRQSYYSQEELEKWFLKSTNLPSCEIQKLAIQADPDRPKALFDYEVTVRKYGSKGGKRIFVPANCINPFDNVPDAVEERHHPVAVKRGYLESDEIILQLPEGYKIESIPNETMELTSEFGEYSIQVENNEETGELIYQRKLKILPVELPAERYNELREFYLQIAKADKMKLVLVEKKT